MSKTAKSKSRKKSNRKKVPVKNHKMKAVKLVCPNCGEEEVRILYCNGCDSDMDILEIVEMDKDEANGNAGVVHDKEEKDDIEDSEDDVTESDILGNEDDPMKDGLSDIFPGGDDMDQPTDDELNDMSMDDVVDILDEE
jgi:predicted RNA-binding Zn-ribbon protein involved in translation (DUF1610 family)